MNVKDIVEANMKMRRLTLGLISVAVLIACSNDPIINPNPNPEPKTDGNKIALKVHVPKGSLGTYAGESASAQENYIDTLFIDLYQGTPLTLASMDTITGANLKRANDSIVNVDYEVNGLTAPVSAKVYANRKKIKVISSEISLPAGNAATKFLMTDSIGLDFINGSYSGTAHIVRDVAKLKINVSKDPACIPADLRIDYGNIKIQISNVPNQTSLFGNKRGVAQSQSGYVHFNYTERPARLSATASNLANANGGQIDSAYINENYRSGNYADAEKIQVKVTIPTLSASLGNKTSPHVFTLYTNSQTNFDILRNYIYVLDIKVRGQSIEPLVSLDVRTWNDVSMEGSIFGSYLTMRTSEIEFDENGYADVAFCTDAQAVYVDYSDFNTKNSMKIGKEIAPVNIYPTDLSLTPDYQGQVIVDKKVCTSFGFRLPANINPAFYNFSGKICIKAGNIRKCVSFVGKRTYDAHFIVGENLFNPGDQFTYASVTTENNQSWLEVSPDRTYTPYASNSYSGAAKPLYLHLDENLTGSIRKGSVTLISNNIEKKIYIQQLPALPVGRFGFAAGNEQLWTEQLYEYSTLPVYGGTLATDQSVNSNIYNGLGTSATNEIVGNYSSNLDWQATTYKAINYCAYKNRPERMSNGILVDIMKTDYIKWYLPSQAQLMALWVSYEALKNAPASNFKTDSYWSATNNGQYANEAQYLNFNYGNVGHYYRTIPYWVRCVRSSGTAPTMVTAAADKRINIDFSKLPAGVHNNTTKVNVICYDSSAVNATVYPHLLIDSADNGKNTGWEAAKLNCTNLGSGWRLPTQKELQAIWILKSEIAAINNGFTSFANDYYWTMTERSSTYPNAYIVYMSSGPAGEAGNTPHSIKTYKASVRCVKEL